MIIKTFEARNFKGLRHVKVDFEQGVNLIVGPNAVGKTSILDAIRLVKGVLAPRTQTETFETLSSLGAATQFARNKIILSALVGVVDTELLVSCDYLLSPEEMASLRQSKRELAEESLRKQTNFGDNLSAWISFTSNFQGIAMLNEATQQVEQAILTAERNGSVIQLGLRGDAKTNQVWPIDPTAPSLFSFLEGRQSHRLTRFSYFPADRALPRGEQPVQLGTQDATQTLESHSSKGELKYSRIKNHIFNALIEGEQSRREISDEFAAIFDSVLRGRRLGQEAFGVNQYGQLSITVSDSQTGQKFDIDQMSSGEKSLILTFLLIGRSLSDGGIVLLDEPELHLNPAVCRDVLDFLVTHYVQPKKLQVISCTHSPEIVAAAFARDDCHIFHLASGDLLAKARRQDDDEVAEALRRLGTSEAESLLYPSTVFVEGETDIEILEAGFGDILRRQNLKSLGGRNEVEKAIRTFQSREKQGVTFPPKYFLFDLDKVPTKLASSRNVKLQQLGRTCIENYLLDVNVLADILQEEGISCKPVMSAGRLEDTIRRLAVNQLHSLSIKEVFSQEAFEGFGLRSVDTEDRTVQQCAAAFSARFVQVRASMASFNEDAWATEFIQKVANYEAAHQRMWEQDWQRLCDGKRMFADLKKEYAIRLPLDKLKLRVAREIRSQKTPSWVELNGTIKNLLA